MSSTHPYSHHARRALSHAEVLAKRYAHPRKDTAHLLVGLMMAEGSIGANILLDFDLDIEVCQVYLKRLIRPLETPIEPPIVAESFQQALELAADEADWLGHHYLGTEHLLLGITRTNVGNADQLLKLVDITTGALRRRVRRALRDGPKEFSLESIRRNARLSELSRRVLYAAEDMALSLDHQSVGIGHLLLALVQERRGVTARYLQQSHLDADLLLEALDQQEPSLLLHLESVLQGAIDHAGRLGNHYVGADHLLLSIASIAEGVIILQAYGASPDKIHRLLSKYLRD